MTLKILNLYAGIGGNRKLWSGDIEVTAIELNPDIANIYKQLFPKDKVIIGDAHQYLLEHHNEFDFIWSSPPCPTHSITNHFLNAQNVVRYPDMSLYQEIIYLQSFFKGKYCVENVKPYYIPLIPAQSAGRHCFWCNFIISNPKSENFQIGRMNGKNQHRVRSKLQKRLDFDLKDINHSYKEKLLNNCVDPKLALHIFNMAFKEKQKQLINL